VEREAALRKQWSAEVEQLRADAKAQRLSHTQEIRSVIQAASQSAAAADDQAPATPAGRKPPAPPKPKTVAAKAKSSGGKRAAPQSAAPLVKQQRRRSPAPTSPRHPGEPLRLGGPSLSTPQKETYQSEDVLHPGTPLIDGVDDHNPDPNPASPRAPFVEFVGAPVGKGAKVPTGLLSWPASITRTRSKTI
jgi:hypothetical protein